MPQGLVQWNPHISSTHIPALAKLYFIVKVLSAPPPGRGPHGQKEGVFYENTGRLSTEMEVLEDLRVHAPIYSHLQMFLSLSLSLSYSD